MRLVANQVFTVIPSPFPPRSGIPPVPVPEPPPSLRHKCVRRRASCTPKSLGGGLFLDRTTSAITRDVAGGFYTTNNTRDWHEDSAFGKRDE